MMMETLLMGSQRRRWEHLRWETKSMEVMVCSGIWQSGVIGSSQYLGRRTGQSCLQRGKSSDELGSLQLIIRFSIPVMINPKTSEQIVHTLSHASLGARPHPSLAPRPLFDPMADHAIVLYDPTIDDKPIVEVIDEEAAEAERKKREEEAKGPHKSLKAILGIVDVKKKLETKVPVVIDPRLAKMLRPHQIEGVKVCLPLSQVSRLSWADGSFCTNVRRV